MTAKTALAALVLILAPGLAAAACFGMHQPTAAACAEGQVWDTVSGACVALPTS